MDKVSIVKKNIIQKYNMHMYKGMRLWEEL